MEFIVYNGEYPFNQQLGVVYAETAEEALTKALNEHGNHCVIGPVQDPGADNS